MRSRNIRLKKGRREFCRRAALAACGACALSGLPSINALAAVTDRWSDVESELRENIMEKRVKAVTAKVTSIKECGIHKVGDTCIFTETGVQGKICIHAMYSMLPKVFAMTYGATFPWLKNPDVATHACPDAANPVVFEITRVYED